MTEHRRPTKEELEKLLSQGRSCREIADQYGVAVPTIYRWRHNYNFFGRRRYAGLPESRLPIYWRKGWLKREYEEKGRSACEIAKECGVNPESIYYALRSLGISVRHPPIQCKDKGWLYHQYIEEGKSLRQIGDELGIDPETVRRWMKKFQIPIRDSAGMRVNHIRLSKKATDFIWGELLGDGSIFMHSNVSAYISYGSQYRGYLEWLSKILSSFGIEQQSKITSHKSRGTISFHYCSKSYRELAEIRKLWYPDGKKHVPTDLKLTPIMMRQWYIGDGSLETGPKRSNGISFATHCFNRDELAFLADQLSSFNLPISLPASRNIIRIGARGVERFLDLIGPCPKEIEPWYGYKWAIGVSKTNWIENIRPRLLEQSSNKIKEKGGEIQ